MSRRLRVLILLQYNEGRLKSLSRMKGSCFSGSSLTSGVGTCEMFAAYYGEGNCYVAEHVLGQAECCKMASARNDA